MNENNQQELAIIQDAQPSLFTYWLAVRRHRRLVLITMVAAGAFLWLRPQATKGVARIQFNTSIIAAQAGPSISSLTAVQNQAELITGHRTLSGVVDCLDLCHRWAQPGETLTPADAAARLKEKLQTTRRPDQTFVDVIATDPDQTMALSLANATAEVFVANLAQDQKRARALPAEALRKELENRQQQLDTARDEVVRCRDEANLASIDAGGLDETSLGRARQQLADLRIDIAGRDARLLVLQQLASHHVYGVFSVLANDESTRLLVLQLNDADQQYADATARYGPDHPELHRVADRATNLRNQLEAHLADRIHAAQTDRVVAEARSKAIAARIEQNPFAAQTEWRLKDNLAAAQHAQQQMSMAVDDVQTQLRNQWLVPEQAAPATIVDAAQLVQMPFGIVLLITTSVGLCAGLLMAILLDAHDTSFKHMCDFERHLSLPVLGVIGTLAPASRPTAVTAQREAYRILRNQLMSARASRPFSSLCLLSAGAGEGKSFTVANLASVWAELGLRVLVVDTDLHNPSAHHFLGVGNEKGLADYTAGDLSFEQIVQSTSVPRVSVIAAGHARPGAAFVTPDRIRQLVSTAAGKFDLVLYDTPAMLQVSDAGIVAAEVGTCLLVVQHCGYPKHMARRARQMLQGINVRTVGLLVNKVHPAERSAFFGYRDYYYYNRRRNKPGAMQLVAGPADTTVRIAA